MNCILAYIVLVIAFFTFYDIIQFQGDMEKMVMVYTHSTDNIKYKNSRIEELLELISCGDTSSMGLLYDLIKTDVFAFALSKTGNKHDADDIMQDTFVQIYKYAKLYTPQGKPMAWIITLELNLIRRQYQLKSRSTSFETCFSNTPSNENLEEKVVNNTFLFQLLETLNEEEREIISLHIVSGMKHREIAKILNKPLSTILSKYNRAIKKLKSIGKEV